MHDVREYSELFFHVVDVADSRGEKKVPVRAATVSPEGALTHTSPSMMPPSHKLLSNLFSQRRILLYHGVLSLVEMHAVLGKSIENIFSDFQNQRNHKHTHAFLSSLFLSASEWRGLLHIQQLLSAYSGNWYLFPSGACWCWSLFQYESGLRQE